MKFLKLLLVGVLLASVTACSRVERGEVGILFNLYGSDKGVNEQVVGPGRYWLTPNEELFTYPTFTQNKEWARVEDADKKVQDNSISFQSREGMVVSGDVGISYSLDKGKIPLIFQKYRKGVDEITDVYVRNHVRDALTTLASTMAVEDIYGPRRNELITEAAKLVRNQVGGIGINVEKLYWMGSLRLPPEIQAAINSKLKATQMAQQRENEVAQAKAEADKAVAEARGQADSTVLKAEAEAKAIRIRGEALKENQKLVDLTLAEKWDGKLPVNMYGGGAVPFINVK